MQARKLPDYQGPLGAASWSSFALTPESESSLRAAALRNCPHCAGRGLFMDPDRAGRAHPCACVNRREERRDPVT